MRLIIISLLGGLLWITMSWPATAQGKRRAVVVGVAGFEHGYASLEYTARDARRTAAALEDLGYSVSLLAADADAGVVNYADVLKALQAASSRSQSGDTLLFFFAGHGSRRMDKDYLLLSDSDPDNFATTALAFDTLSDIVTNSRATRRVFVIDACRNTSQRADGKPGFADGKLDKGFKDALDKLATKQVPGADIQTAVLYACSPGETSKESVEERAGLFTQRFVQSLQLGSTMQLTLGEIIGYVRSHMPATVEQTPLLVGPETLQIGPAGPRVGRVLPDIVTSRPILKINERDGAVMVYVPAATFTMGDADQADNPPHKVSLRGYYIYRNLVTVAQFRQFCAATGHEMPRPPKWGWKDDHPVVNVRYEEAQAYCAWAGVRLPTEAEWEKAARGTDGRKYPWGDVYDASRLQCSKGSLADSGSTAPVGSFPNGASPYGALDMAGNVWQWCSDWFDAEYWKRPTFIDPTGPPSGRYHVMRGGGWGGVGAANFRSSNRDCDVLAAWPDGDGFRCASW